MSVIPFCVVMIAARGLVATNSQHIDLYANALGVAVCFLACSFLIPRYGAMGAAIAQLLSFLSMALVETIYLSRKIINFRVWQKAGFSSVSLFVIYIIIWNY
jgi:O-antigen/teichoic acid export membrane protein